MPLCPQSIEWWPWRYVRKTTLIAPALNPSNSGPGATGLSKADPRPSGMCENMNSLLQRCMRTSLHGSRKRMDMCENMNSLLQRCMRTSLHGSRKRMYNAYRSARPQSIEWWSWRYINKTTLIAPALNPSSGGPGATRFVSGRPQAFGSV